MDPPFEVECTSCGACCFGHKVYVSPEDEGKLSVDEVLELTELDAEGDRVMSRYPDGRCVALWIQQGRFTCAIYDRRPKVCVDFERGGRRCLEWRERVDTSGWTRNEG